MSTAFDQLRNETLASAVLESMPDAALLVDAAGIVVYANSRIEELLGWPVKELVGSSVDLLVPKDVVGHHAALRKRFADSPASRPMGTGLELDAVHRDGSLVPVEISLSPLGRGYDDLVIAAIRDGRPQRQLRYAHTQIAMLEDRDRIGRDLHDGVIQQLYAAGLHLQASSGRPDQDARVARVIDEIDRAIKEIRMTIFTLHSQRGLTTGLEHGLRVALAESSRLLGYEPSLEMSDRLETISAELGGELLIIVRELLSNIVKHARSTSCTVSVAVCDAKVRLIVEDNGLGITSCGDSAGSGLRNLAERAAARGGITEIRSAVPSGTVVSWTVPLGNFPRPVI